MAARTLLKRGLERSCGTHKEAARLLNYSPEMLCRIFTGERNIAPDIKPKMSRMHMIAGLALAAEATGYNIFQYLDGDRHPQTMIRRVEKEDAEADEALRPIGWRIINKNTPEDLTEDDKTALRAAATEIIHRVIAELNMLVEWEDRYSLGLLDYITGKEKGLVAETRAAY